jgi:hypothetical protein
VTKLLGVTLHCKLSRSKTYWYKMGRSLPMIRWCSTFLTALSTRQVLQALVLLHLDYCSVVWSGATSGSEQGSTAGPWMCTELILIVCMSISPGSKWRRHWLHHCCIYERYWAVCFNYWLTALTPMHTPQDMPRCLFTVPKSRKDYGRHTVLHRAMTTSNSIPQYYIEPWLHGTLFHIK